MVLSTFLTLKWDRALRQIQKEVKKFQILAMMRFIDIRNFMRMMKHPGITV
jgi:hypothetical protein